MTCTTRFKLQENTKQWIKIDNLTKRLRSADKLSLYKYQPNKHILFTIKRPGTVIQIWPMSCRSWQSKHVMMIHIQICYISLEKDAEL